MVLPLLLQAAPAHAIDSHDTQLRTFASCAGRLSAVMEYQWMFDGAASERTMAERAALLDILEAVAPPERGRDILAWRIDAKMAHAQLMTSATFSQVPRQRVWAERMAARHLAECRGFLLS